MNTEQTIAEHYLSQNIEDAAHTLDKLESKDVADFVGQISTELAVKVLMQMNTYKAAKSIEFLDAGYAARLFEQFDLTSAAILLRSCSEAFQREVMANISPKLAEKISQKIEYAHDTVGTLMKPTVFSIREDQTIRGTLEFIKSRKRPPSTEIFVTDEKRRLVGIVKIVDLVIAEGAEHIASIMIRKVPRCYGDDPIRLVLDHPMWAEYRSIPVIDWKEELVGALHFGDIISSGRKADSEKSRWVLETGSALGELYRIGISSLLQSSGTNDTTE